MNPLVMIVVAIGIAEILADLAMTIRCDLVSNFLSGHAIADEIFPSTLHLPTSDL